MNHKGFTVLEVILIIVVLGAIGSAGYLAYLNMKTDTKSAASTESAKVLPADDRLAKIEKIIPKNETHATYTNSKLTYTFDFPSEWKVKGTLTGEYLENVTLTSPDYEKVAYQNGKSDTVKGAVIVFTTMSSYSGESPLQFDGSEAVYYKKGTLKAEIIDLGSHKGVEYTITDESPKMAHVRVLFGGQNNFIPTSFQAADDETASPHYKVFKEVLASVR